MSDSNSKNHARSAAHVALLVLFTALFALRIAAQLMQYASPTAFLPPFDAWQGSELDYPLLLTSQILILAAMVWGAWAVYRRGRVRESAGRWLIVLGAVYFAWMSARLVLGFTVLSALAWFAKPLPAVFHLVLAGYVLTFGHYHARQRG
jgi:hypothetical protein